ATVCQPATRRRGLPVFRTVLRSRRTIAFASRSMSAIVARQSSAKSRASRAVLLRCNTLGDGGTCIFCNRRRPIFRLPRKAKNPAVLPVADTPKGIRTPVSGLRTRSPGPLDDGGQRSFSLPDLQISRSDRQNQSRSRRLTDREKRW